MYSSSNSSHLSAASARTNLVRNEQQTCSASGCHLPRFGFNSMCRRHKPRARMYGHPTAQAIKSTEYRQEVQQVQQLFAENGTHPGLVAALQGIGAWMRQAAAAEGVGVKAQPYPSAPEVARLVRHGVQPMDLLVTLCGVSQWLRLNSRRLPSDKARDFMLSHALLKLAPRPVKVSRTHHNFRVRPKFAALDHLGKFLRVWLADFVAVVQLALEQREQQRQQLQSDLRRPFEAPVVAFLDEVKPA